MEHYEDGTLSRGEWKLSDGTLSHCAESFEQARAIKAELQSLGGAKLEADEAFLYCAPADESEALRELAEAGFAVSGDSQREPLRFDVETVGKRATDNGILALRFSSAIEAEARARFHALRESDEVREVHLYRRDPEDGSRKALEIQGCDSGPSLLEACAPFRGTVYEVFAEDLEEYSELGYSALRERVSLAEARESMRAGRARFVFVPDHATGSDYGGDGAIGKANLRALRELAEESGLTCGSDFWELSGAHSSYGIAFRLGLRSAAIVEALAALENYPLLDEELHSEIECEEDSEAWEAFYCSDFRRALESREDLEIGAPSAELWKLFRAAADRSNTYFEHDSSGASIDVDRVAEAVTREEILALSEVSRADEAEQLEALAQLNSARAHFEPLGAGSEWAEDPASPSAPALADIVGAARVALGAPSREAVEDCAAFLAQVSRWPIAAERQLAQHPKAPEHALEDCAAELAKLREDVGNVVRAAREQLEALAPAHYARAIEGRPFGPLPIETTKRD